MDLSQAHTLGLSLKDKEQGKKRKGLSFRESAYGPERERGRSTREQKRKTEKRKKKRKT